MDRVSGRQRSRSAKRNSAACRRGAAEHQAWRASQAGPTEVRQKEQDMIVVPSSLCSINRIIGCRGTRMNKFQKDSGARIDYSDESGTTSSYVFLIVGSKRSVMIAKAFIEDLVEEIGTLDVEERLKISKEVSTRIIGPGGSTVETLQKESGASIDIITTTIPSVACIRGTIDSVERATKLISNMFDNSGMSVFGDGAEDHWSESVEVPNAMVRRILGWGGRDKETEIAVAKPSGDTTRLTITGSNASVVKVLDLISELMDYDRTAMEEARVESPRIYDNITLVIPHLRRRAEDRTADADSERDDGLHRTPALFHNPRPTQASARPRPSQAPHISLH
ncbi:unnamed protein product [Prorocentrum cordatum]|uniref:K Homology domain-containing protein n=1 Tax=Prorocentrum cordatum TaxID=2364126 RepID=A0ABN9WRB1_9DINO|nr:unnamed protein product [Polarella glacialis]